MRTLNACSLSALVGRVMTACEEVVRRVALPVQALVAKRCDAHCLQFLCSFCQVSAHLIDIASLQSQVELQTSILFPTAAIPIIMSATFCPLKKTSQELRMLSSVTINCKITEIVMNSGSQLSEL